MARDIADKAKRSAIAASLLILESLIVLALGIYMVALGFTHDKDWMPYLSVIAFAFGGSAALYALSWGVKNERRWANSPAILANLIALGVAKYQFEAGAYWLAVPITALAASIIVLVIQIVKNSNNKN
jgi:peptidoglycan/LPS O-acetylase OafA/YrhL